MLRLAASADQFSPHVLAKAIVDEAVRHRPAPAEQIGAVLGIDEVRAEQTPADKVSGVRAERDAAVTVMVGDGVNDAPALAAANVGVAMGAHGSTASSEAADIVLTTDRLDRLADAMLVARRSRRIALQSAIAGIALSVLAMGFAAAGCCPPRSGRFYRRRSTWPSSSTLCGRCARGPMKRRP